MLLRIWRNYASLLHTVQLRLDETLYNLAFDKGIISAQHLCILDSAPSFVPSSAHNMYFIGAYMLKAERMGPL